MNQVQHPSVSHLFGNMTARPWQERAVIESIARIQAGQKAFCVSGPTGSGKSLTMVALMRWCVNQGKSATLYTNRKMLTSQLIQVLQSHGLPFGVQAAEFEQYESRGKPIQICATTTENVRVLRRRDKLVNMGVDQNVAKRKHALNASDLVLIDEIHMNKGDVVSRILAEHQSEGSTCIGMTATPVGISHLFPDGLVMAGTVSECRKHGALVPAYVFSCEEMDTRKLKRQKTGEFSLGQIRKEIWSPKIFGFVYDNWKRLNPNARPALGFAPGVQESIWIAGQMLAKGVRSAHIDGTDCWLDGKQYKSSPEARADILEMFKDGRVKTVWNRFVMREGLDVPWLYHLILATPIGAIQSYIQICGRVLRSSPETPDAVIISDHAGNVWRHGSPNVDRDWQAFWELPAHAMTAERIERIRDGIEKEPIVCPQCAMIRASGPKCPKCGHEAHRAPRKILQTNGELASVFNNVKPRKTVERSDTQAKWDAIYWGSRNATKKLESRYEKVKRDAERGRATEADVARARKAMKDKQNKAMSFEQAYSAFFLEHHYHPPKTLNNMPLSRADWFQKVYKLDRSLMKKE